VCLCVCTINCRNNTSISNFRGGFRWQSEYPWCIIEVKCKYFPIVLKKKKLRKTEMFTQNQFSTKSIF
ncbi:Uncharacterized protein FWK35_00032396, partial [Aphis craccivora]